VIEMLDTIAGDMPRVPRTYLLHRLEQLGVKILVGARVEAISDLGILVNVGSRQRLIEGFTSIVLATGSRPVNGLAEELKSVVKQLYVVGDAREVARIADATAQAAEAALSL
jgi:NADH dehydrogenase FAD-containing subunit